MTRFFGPATIILALALALAAVLLVGCGKGEQTAQQPSDAGGMPPGLMPMPGMPPPGPGGQGPPMPGMPPMPGVPGTAPQAGATGGEAAASAPVAPVKGQVPFEKVALKSPVTRVSFKQDGVSVDYLRFKYADWDGKVRPCEMPASLAKEDRTPEDWIATFDIYKQELPATTAQKKKKQVERMTDFPFVSPPPPEQPRTQPTSGYPMPGAGYGMPAVPSGSEQTLPGMPAPAMPTPGVPG